jgi:hypothetical protein
LHDGFDVGRFGRSAAANGCRSVPGTLSRGERVRKDGGTLTAAR